MRSVTVLATAAGLAGVVSAHAHQHEHLHKRDTATTTAPCPAWTGGHRPPAYLTDLPLSIQAELPAWTGAPPSDWCSGTAWMQSYVSCATVYESCSASATTTTSGYNSTTKTGYNSTTKTGYHSTTKTGSATATGTVNGTAIGTGTWSTWADPTTSPTGTWATWSDSADPTATSTTTGTWSSWSDPADPTATSTSTSTWGSWSDSADPTTTSTSTWGSWSASADPTTTSTSTWGSWSDSADPTATSTSTSTWGSWADPNSTYAAPAQTSTSTTTWGSWVDPSSTTAAPVATSTSSYSTWFTGWGSWVDPASSSTSSVCGCTTVTVTVTGDPVWIPDSATTTTVSTTTYTTVTVVPTQAGSSTWGSWSDPNATASSSTTWGSWSDPSSTVSSSTTSWASWGSSTSFSTSTTTSSSTSTSTPTGGSGNAAIAPAGSLWAITYSPYTASGGCKDAGSVTADITAIKALGFTTVRIYSTDCSGLENVGTAARAVGLQLILGVFIEASGVSGAQPQVSEIVAWGQWDLVEMIVVGNEALFNQYLSVTDLAGFISSSKWAFSNAGYTGPVTTTEPLSSWISEGSSLCSAIDVVAANIHAFFNAQTDASQAGSFLASELTILENICSGKKTYIVESGWPHAGDSNGAAVPGVAEQATALASIQSTCGSQVVFFTFEDDLWKAPGAFNVEQSWGCASVFKNGTSW